MSRPVRTLWRHVTKTQGEESLSEEGCSEWVKNCQLCEEGVRLSRWRGQHRQTTEVRNSEVSGGSQECLGWPENKVRGGKVGDESGEVGGLSCHACEPEPLLGRWGLWKGFK